MRPHLCFVLVFLCVGTACEEVLAPFPNGEVPSYAFSEIPAPWGGTSVSATTAGGDDVVLVGLLEGGLRRSTDGGATWTTVPSYPGTGPESTPRVLVDAGGGTVLAATSVSLLRGSDAGSAWVNIGPAGDYYALATGPGIVLAGEFGGKLQRSRDSGATWEAIPTDLHGVLALASTPSGAWYAGTIGGVYRSMDEGVSWTLAHGQSIANVVFASRSGRVFAGSRLGGFQFSDDGVQWTDLNPAFLPFPAAFPEAMAQSPDGRLYATLDLFLYSSTDDGLNWQRASWYASDRIAAIVPQISSVLVAAEDGVWRVDPEDGSARLVGVERIPAQRVFGGDDDDLYLSGGTGPLSAGLYSGTSDGWSGSMLREARVWAMATVGDDAYAAITSLEEPGLGGVLKRSAGSSVWEYSLHLRDSFGLEKVGGSLYAAISPNPFHTTATHPQIMRTTDGGEHWTPFGQPLPLSASSAWIQFHMAGDGSAVATLYDHETDRDHIFHLAAGSDAWVPLSPGQPGQRLVSAVAFPGGGVVAAIEGAGVRRGDRRNETWTEVSPVPGAAVIALRASREGLLFALTASALHGSGDAGDSWVRLVEAAAGNAFISLNVAADGRVLVGTPTSVLVGRP